MCVHVCVSVCVSVCVCMYVFVFCVHVCACMCVHVCVCMYVCACMCVHVCVCMYVCACMCVQAYGAKRSGNNSQQHSFLHLRNAEFDDSIVAPLNDDIQWGESSFLDTHMCAVG